eukprot:CAMPEP_0117573382 /NCGR_PEP_ID=MMETSP0784-20121206/60924_1 /TAXON_ID=39447 /ORGANISM="" /LENGTH=212 /DNA_ID=CAMNT_0005371943 /DNA_START=44 /DNA_END=679 /DNA_ORIENTATION=-
MSVLLDERRQLAQPAKMEQGGKSRESPDPAAELDDMDALVRLLQKEGLLKREPSAQDTVADGKRRSDLKSSIQIRYLTLLAQGLRANEAAAQAILEVGGRKRASDSCTGQIGLPAAADAALAAGTPAASPRCRELIDEGLALFQAPADSPRSEASLGSATVSSLARDLDGETFREELGSDCDDSFRGVLDNLARGQLRGVTGAGDGDWPPQR